MHNKKILITVIKYEIVMLTQRDVIKCAVQNGHLCCPHPPPPEPHYQCWPVSWSLCDGWQTSCKLSGRWPSPDRTASFLKHITWQAGHSTYPSLTFSPESLLLLQWEWLVWMIFSPVCAYLFMQFCANFFRHPSAHPSGEFHSYSCFYKRLFCNWWSLNVCWKEITWFHCRSHYRSATDVWSVHF